MQKLYAVVGLAVGALLVVESSAGSMPIGGDAPPMRFTPIAQLSNGIGPNGPSNGTGTGGGPPSVLNPSGSNFTATPQGTTDLKPNGSSGRPNGSKPAPMDAKGVRKIN